MHAYFISLSARSRETKQVNKDRIDTENILSLYSTLCWCCNYGTVLGPPPSLRADSFFAQKLAQNKSDWWRDARDHRIACVPSVSTQVFCANTCREREPKILFSSGSNFGTLTRAEAFATKANHRKGERRETFSPSRLPWREKFSSRERRLDSRQVLGGCTKVEKGLLHTVSQHNTDHDQ